MADKLEQAVAKYLYDLHQKRSLGAGQPERSYYPILADLLNAIGADLKPPVLSLTELQNTGVGNPDFGLFTKTQCQRGEPRSGQRPERGVVEVKPVADDAWLTAGTAQVSRYWAAYRLVLVTNYRDFLIVGEDASGHAAKLESFRIAADERTFWQRAATPQRTARTIGKTFAEYLKRALTQSVALREPKDVAWFLASYARDALQRVEDKGALPALATVRKALEEALGVAFEGEKGDHFFRSTLVQTLFYGVFSAWVLWARQEPRSSPTFDWRTAVWHLKVPMLRALFQQLADPGQLEPLRLVEVLNWTAATLNRIDAPPFFARFNEADAVQFFYEPFLEAFDPELRKQLGVWYTPSEVVTYMVARVDRALKEDLGVAEGLAAEHVYVLDPCCGTGAYLAAVLKRIDRTLDDRGLGALKGERVKQAATSRIFGFEIMPAPFVVAHLQVGLLLQSLGAPFAADGSERAGVYLTNALTGWEPVEEQPLPFPELEEERRRADEVKQATPILVILGNPPYNGYAGMAVQEERALSDAYRTTRRVRRPEGQGLNDLYVRFYRMAERRIVEMTGQGVVCFISNYSWLDGLSFTGMRERYLEAFDRILVDNLHGDRIISEYTADGRSSETIFAVRGHSPGIRVGTAIATLIKRPQRTEIGNGVWYRDFDHARADERRAALIDASQADTLTAGYQRLSPSLPLGLPFKRMGAGDDYLAWPRLPELFPASFPGVNTARDDFVVAIDRATLEARLQAYFDPAVSHADLRARYPSVMTASARYNPEQTRDTLRRRGGPLRENIVRYAYRPFDIRWLYWEPETDLLDRKREEYWPHVFDGNMWITAAKSIRKGEQDPQHAFLSVCGSYHLIEKASLLFPAYLRHEHAAGGGEAHRPNLTRPAAAFLSTRGLGVEDLFHHALAVLHAPAYRRENAAALRMDWPRVPVPDDTAALTASTALGRALAALLDPETPVPGVTAGAPRAELRILGVPTRPGGGNLGEADRALTAGWGSLQGSGIVMPGRGKLTEREYRPEERGCLQDALPLLAETTFDIHLNADAYWANVPVAVWRYSLGGYPVIKKWLSYRELSVLGRALSVDEVIFVSGMVRRIAAILLLGPALDANYHNARTNPLWQPPDRHSTQGRHSRRKAGRPRGRA